MSVLVTGATGRLGRVLVERLLAEGKSVRILTRRPFKAVELFGQSLPIHEWHPFSEDVPPVALSDVSAVAHLMGEPLSGRANARKLERIRASRLTPTSRLVAALSGRSVRFVMASVPVLAARPVEQTADESALHDTSRGALSAAAREHEDAAHAARQSGSSVAIVRLGLMLAPGEPWSSLARLASLRIGLPLADAIIPAIDLDDAAALFMGLLERDELEGAINGVAPDPLYGSDLAAVLAKAAGAHPRFHLPERFVPRYAGELSRFLLNRSRVRPGRLLDAGATFAEPDPKASLMRALGPTCPPPMRPRRRVWPFAKARAS